MLQQYSAYFKMLKSAIIWNSKWSSVITSYHEVSGDSHLYSVPKIFDLWQHFWMLVETTGLQVLLVLFFKQLFIKWHMILFKTVQINQVNGFKDIKNWNKEKWQLYAPGKRHCTISSILPPNFQMNACAAECKVSVTASAPMGMWEVAWIWRT